MDKYIYSEAEDLVKKLKEHQYGNLFLQPIEEIIALYPNYTMVIQKPIDLIKISVNLQDGIYQNLETFKADVDLMFLNCKTFNSYKKSWAYKATETMESLFNREYKKSLTRIQKYEILTKQKNDLITQHNIQQNNNIENPNIQIVSSSEDDKIYKRIKNVFQKLGTNLNVNDQQREEIIALIVKSIVKRNKSFEQIYEDTMKFLTKNLNNVNNIKSYFARKFRKLLRSLKDEQTGGSNQIDKGFNIKINLNETEEKRDEKAKLDVVKKEVLNFIDNQKVPEVFRNLGDYPIEPSLRKKISTYVTDLRNTFLTQY